MYRTYYDIHKDNHKAIEEEFGTSMERKVRCAECGWHGMKTECKIEVVDGWMDAIVCPECYGTIEDVR